MTMYNSFIYKMIKFLMYSNLFSTNRKLLFIVLRKCIVSIFLIFINNTQPINDVTSISY